MAQKSPVLKWDKKTGKLNYALLFTPMTNKASKHIFKQPNEQHLKDLEFIEIIIGIKNTGILFDKVTTCSLDSLIFVPLRKYKSENGDFYYVESDKHRIQSIKISVTYWNSPTLESNRHAHIASDKITGNKIHRDIIKKYLLGKYSNRIYVESEIKIINNNYLLKKGNEISIINWESTCENN